jgi:hypothetical protein
MAWRSDPVSSPDIIYGTSSEEEDEQEKGNEAPRMKRADSNGLGLLQPSARHNVTSTPLMTDRKKVSKLLSARTYSKISNLNIQITCRYI